MARTVILLGIVSLLTDVSSEMVSAVLPLYLTAQLGLGLLAYGLIDGLYQGLSSVVRIAGGYAGDRYQAKWVATVGYGVSALSRLAMLPVTGAAGVIGVVTADRLGKGLRTAPRDALIVEVSDPKELGRAFGIHRTLDTIGAAIGPVVAFALLLGVPNGYSSVWVVSFAVAAIGFAVLVLFVPNNRTTVAGTRLTARALLGEIAAARLRRPLLAAAVLGVLTIGDGFLYLSLQYRDDFAAKWFPLLYVGTNVAYLTLALPIGRLADRIGRAKVLVLGHLALLSVYLLASLPAGGLTMTLACLLFLGIFYAATDGVLPALISRLVPAQARGTGIAAAQTVVALTRFVSSMAFSTLWLAIGSRNALLVAAVLLGATVPIAGWLLAPSDRAVA